MRTPAAPLHVVLVNLALVPGVRPEEMLGRLPGLGRFAASLAEAGARATVLARAEEEADLTDGSVRLVTTNDGDEAFARYRSPAPGILRRLRRLSPDVVHVGGLLFPVPTAAVRAAMPRRVPVLLQHHGEPPGRGRLGLLQRLLLRSADGVLFTSREIADEWIRGGHLQGDTGISEVLEASTDLAPVPRDEAREATGIDGDPAILWVGRLHPRKDPVTALRAFEGALPDLPDSRLHLVHGEAPLLEELRSRCAASPALARAVRFVGPVAHSDLSAWYSAADLFLTSSPSEGSNWAFIEATACGLPAVATDIPANRRVSGPGTELFPAGDAGAGAAALARAARDPAA
ncbi:MAG: glycosyltransferase family 4 protein, partial [Thermoanaerobaculia bacterium]|nr:glycosyltransferase family 4 protein [Thermoanaerobaculia bacterium]